MLCFAYIWKHFEPISLKVEQDSHLAFLVCPKCRGTLVKFHQFYLETRKNYECFQKIRKSSTTLSVKEGVPIKTEELVDESEFTEDLVELKTEIIEPDVKEENDSEPEMTDHHETVEYEPISRKKKRSNTKRKSYTSRQKPYVCDLCGKTIRRYMDLKSHIEKIHLRLRKFQCHLCGDNFFASNNLKFHLTTHDTSRPRSQCKLCGVLVLDLKKHFKTSHNDSNPVVCNICGKSVMNEMKLRYHTYKRHPPQGKYKCTLCDKDFCNALYLKEHTHQKHIGGFLYTCEWCDFQTNYSKNMPTHQKLKHKEEFEARRRARPPMLSRVHEMKATLALQAEAEKEHNVS